MLWPCGMTVRVAVVSSVWACVPFKLFLKISSTPMPPRLTAPVSVTVGPGLFSQPDVDSDVWTCTGVVKLVLTVVSPWAIDARPSPAKRIAVIAIFFKVFSAAAALSGYFIQEI